MPQTNDSRDCDRHAIQMLPNVRHGAKSVLQKLVRFLMANTARRVVPLAFRQKFVVQFCRRSIRGQSFLSTELLRDLADKDLATFHRFFWEHHAGGLSYGRTYEIGERFGDENLRFSRR